MENPTGASRDRQRDLTVPENAGFVELFEELVQAMSFIRHDGGGGLMGSNTVKLLAGCFQLYGDHFLFCRRKQAGVVL
jgi:hypothetical protein